MHDFYQSLHVDLGSLLRTVLKGNDSLQYAMITGIQRVVKENVFSDLNNLVVYTVMDTAYEQYFGFTEQETRELLEYYGLEYTDEVKNMYDGYHIGNLNIYNPWSIIHYAAEKELNQYWVNTSSNDMIRNAMKRADISFKKGYVRLIENGFLDTNVSTQTSFYEQSNTANLWGLFVNAGYLTVEKKLQMRNYRIRIPNGEVREEFMNLTAEFLQISDSILNDLFVSLINRNSSSFLGYYQDVLLSLPSYMDLINENSYHMLLLGMCAWLYQDYEIISNREEGSGRCDIILKANNDHTTSFVLELKYTKSLSVDLTDLAQEAVDQIKKKQYDHDLAGSIVYIGLAHRGKDVKMFWQES